jgi:hypothetical protein
MVPRAVSTVLDGLLVAAQQNEFGLPSAWRHVEAEGDYVLGYPSAVLADLGHPDQWAAACDAEGLTPSVELLITRLEPTVQKLMDEVEALYGRTRRVLGVQWHPERANSSTQLDYSLIQMLLSEDWKSEAQWMD